VRVDFLGRLVLCAFVGDLSMHVALGSFSYRAQALGATAERLGWVQGVADLVYCVVALTLPRFTDGKSRRAMVRCAALTMAAGGALCWQAGSLGAFVGALILLRSGTALFWPTLEARMSDEHFADLGRAVSAFSLAWSCGKALGYGVNAVLFSQAVAPATSFAITAVGSLVLVAIAPRDHARDDGNGAEAASRPRAPLVRVLAAWGGVFLACGAFIVLQNQNAPLMAAKAHSGSFGNLMLAVLVGFNMLMFEVLRRKPGLAGADGALLASVGLLFAGLAAMLVASHPAALLGGAALIGVGMGLAYTQSLFLSLGLPHGKSVSAGIHEAFIGLANASLAPLAGLATAWRGNANGALLFALVLVGAGGAFVLACVRRGRRAPA
jgi:predicted MFS family arabinose efflux permease